MAEIWIASGGPRPELGWFAHKPDRAPLICADSGLDHALAAGARPTLVVGDLDSVSDRALAWAERLEIEVQRAPRDKDELDLELALTAALERHASTIVVLAGDGGRLDMAVASLMVLTQPRWADIQITAFVGAATVTVVRGERELLGRAGDLVSLLPVGGPARVHTRGLRFGLAGDELAPWAGRGVSNELTGSRATVRVEAGVVLAIQPEGPRPSSDHRAEPA
ncbi:MAG: thiamine diphosphokinase [Acidimicrobiales bacterium]|nr:thiamine diphosphokinase [Acidimicrobiales bacterium]